MGLLLVLVLGGGARAQDAVAPANDDTAAAADVALPPGLAAERSPGSDSESAALPSPAVVDSPGPANAEARADELAVQAQLDAILAEQSSAHEASADGPSLHFYGFADALFAKSFPQMKDAPYPLKYARFFVGNVNLYAAADLTGGFSSLLEVRFTYMPNGNIDSETLAYETSESIDPGDWHRVHRWGGIIIERVHLDYSYTGWLNVRIGSFLTPYGIWNVDHGSPTIIPVFRPYPIGEQLFPTRQVGMAAFGNLLLGSTTLGYHVTLSNGRGDIEQIDLDKDKAVGGRLYLSRANVGTFTLGVSAYGGEGYREPSIKVLSISPVRTTDTFEAQFQELSLAADLLWEWRGLRVQAELVSRQVEYRDPSRPSIALSQGATMLVPDFHSWGSYGLLAYRLPWLGIMPYFMFTTFERGFGGTRVIALNSTSTTSAMGLSGGLNVRPVPAVALKAQFMYAWIPGAGKQYTQPQLSFQAAWAF